MRWVFVLLLLAGCAAPQQKLWVGGPQTVECRENVDLTRGTEVNGARAPEVPAGNDLVWAPPDLRLADYSSLYREIPDSVLAVSPRLLPQGSFHIVPGGSWVLAEGTRLPKLVSGPGCYRFERVPEGLSEAEAEKWLSERVTQEIGKPAQRTN